MWGGIVSGLGSFITGLAQADQNRQNTKDMIASQEKIAEQNFQLGQDTNQMNWDIAKLNADIARRMNDDNITFQQQENAITREREDNAVQRRAADLEAAGLSKTLAAGSAASAASLAAPQRRESEQIAHTQAYIAKEMKYDAMKDMVDLSGVMNAFNNLSHSLISTSTARKEYQAKKDSNYWDKNWLEQAGKDLYDKVGKQFVDKVGAIMLDNLEEFKNGDGILKLIWSTIAGKPETLKDKFNIWDNKFNPYSLENRFSPKSGGW